MIMDKAPEYLIKDGYQVMDFEKITSMLTEAYWSIGIKKNEVIKGAQNSALLIGVFTLKTYRSDLPG
jgi:hypothetical protein